MIEVVCAIIQENGLYLIAQRNSKIAMNVWEFPGGKIEHGESHIAAVIREVKEELNLDVEVDYYLCEIWDRSFTPTVHVYAYVVHIVKGTLALHAHKQYRWVKSDNLHKYAFQKVDAPIIEHLQKNAKP